MKRRLLLLALILPAACASPPAPERMVMLAPDLAMALPDPSTLGRDLVVVHLVTARYDGREVSFEGHIEARDGHFLLAVVDPLGRRALSVDWTDGHLHYDAAPFFPEGLRPQNILADLVLIYWPPGVLRRALAPSGATFQASDEGRSVTYKGREVIRAEFLTGVSRDALPGRIRYANLAFGYSLDIRAVGPLQ
jgi:hypothetical protein